MFTNLQVGRIVAASLVLVFHASYYGWYVFGLDDTLRPWAYWFRTTVVFLFALSGFVLAYSFQKTTPLGFIWHRLLRLYPTYWVALILVLVVWYSCNSPHYPRKKLAAEFILYAGGPGMEAPVLHVEWTLVYELFLSMAIVPLAACGRRWGLGIGCGVWLLGILGNQIVIQGTEPPWRPLLLQMPLSVVNVPFLLGVLVYLAPRPPAWLRWIFLLASAASLYAGSDFVLTAPNRCYLFQSLSAALLVCFLVNGRQLSVKNPFVVAGDWSYGVYLIHVPIMYGFFVAVSWNGWPEPSIGLVVFGAVMALVLGCIFGALENRASRRLRKWLTRKPAVPQSAPVSIEPPLRRAA